MVLHWMKNGLQQTADLLIALEIMRSGPTALYLQRGPVPENNKAIHTEERLNNKSYINADYA